MARTPERWEVEDGAFWDSTGRSIANRNLCVMEKGTSTWVGEGASPVTFTMREIATKTSAPPAATSHRRRDTNTIPSCKSENHDGDEP